MSPSIQMVHVHVVIVLRSDFEYMYCNKKKCLHVPAEVSFFQKITRSSDCSKELSVQVSS